MSLHPVHIQISPFWLFRLWFRILWHEASFWQPCFSSCRLAQESGTTTELWFAHGWKPLVTPQHPDISTSEVGTGALLWPCLLQRRKGSFDTYIPARQPSPPGNSIVLPSWFSNQNPKFTKCLSCILRTWLLIYVYFLNLGSVPWLICPRHFPASLIFMIALHGVDFSSVHGIQNPDVFFKNISK